MTLDGRRANQVFRQDNPITGIVEFNISKDREIAARGIKIALLRKDLNEFAK